MKNFIFECIIGTVACLLIGLAILLVVCIAGAALKTLGAWSLFIIIPLLFGLAFALSDFD